MPFYLGQQKYNLYLNGIKYRFAELIASGGGVIPTPPPIDPPIVNDVPNYALISTETFTDTPYFYLADKNGVFLTYLPPTYMLLTPNNEVLVDINDTLLTTLG